MRPCASLNQKFFNTLSLLSTMPFLKNDLGAILGVPNSKYFQYSASHCFVPILYSNSHTCWKSMDLLRFPVTFTDGSSGNLAGSLGVMAMISLVSIMTLSNKAPPTALFIFHASIVIFAIVSDYLIISHNTKR